ncbi:hypothetical protein OIU79_003020 [Salix purpurea]|uniref:Uncharacterized protein n=1 Tax=Salix purpurea TaxID=77065 RepID=A0A9Q0UKV8_SALPP|nr:hypothetical protein OIU79_003020 [Salix purpurea]
MASTSQPTSPSSSSLKQKLKSTLCLSSFHKHHHHNHHHHHRFTVSNSEKHIQQKHDRHVVQEVVNVDSREGFLSCVGKHGHRRRHSMSANFHYDATSYALNFDEGKANDDSVRVYDPHLMSFSSRLPPSPAS